MFDRAHVDSTGRTAAGPLNHYSQTETAVGLAVRISLRRKLHSAASPGALRLDGRSGPA